MTPGLRGMREGESMRVKEHGYGGTRVRGMRGLAYSSGAVAPPSGEQLRVGVSSALDGQATFRPCPRGSPAPAPSPPIGGAVAEAPPPRGGDWLRRGSWYAPRGWGYRGARSVLPAAGTGAGYRRGAGSP